MLGDDANIVFTELLKKLLEIVKMIGESSKSGGRTNEPKIPKIKSGTLSKKDFEKLRNSGMKFGYVTVPKETLGELEKNVTELGGSMFAAKTENGNNAVIAVPADQIEIVNTAMKHIISDTLKDDTAALKVKSGSEKIDEADMKIAADVLRSYDIPVYSFKSADGKFMNVVPKEFDGQYEAAMKEVKEISERLKNIEITRYEQTSPLDGLDVFAVKMSPEAAKALNAAAKANNLDVAFAKYDGSDVAVYPADIAEAVKKAQTEYAAGLEESEKFIIDIKDNTVTMDKDKLLVREDESSYFVKVPNTAGLDYLRLDKSDVETVNDGKTLSMKLDKEKNYTVFDESGRIKSERSGAELAKSYNTKSLRVNKDTVTVKYGDGIERIDLYNAEKNKLISLGMDKADKIRTELTEQGISAKAAENLLKNINDKLSDKGREIFGFTAEKTEIVYADIPNIGEYLAQSQLSQQLVGKAQCYGEIPKDNGSKCCVYDRSANRYTVLPVLPKLEVMKKLTDMGYSEVSAKEIADRVVGSYRESDNVKDIEINENKSVSPKAFETNNPELNNLSYYSTGSSAVIVQENSDSYKYMEIDKGTSMADTQKAVMNSFGIKDERSAAEVMKQLIKEDIIRTAAPVKIEDVTLSQASVNCVEISRDGKSEIMPKNKLDTDRLAAMGISEKVIGSIEKSLKRSEKEALNPGKQTLQGLIKAAKETAAGFKSSPEKAREKTAGRER